MARINIIVPRLSRNGFAGGIWCIFEYAHGLFKRGHSVTIVPLGPSEFPEWYPRPVGEVICSSIKDRMWAATSSIGKVIASRCRPPFSLPKNALRQVGTNLCFIAPYVFSKPIQCGIGEAFVRAVAPEADIQIATCYESARAVSTLQGKRFYLAQHFEPYFCAEASDPIYAETVSRQSYHLGLQLIANSSWLQSMLRTEAGTQEVDLCPNAIDHSVFLGRPKPLSSSNNKIVVISYGGRDAVWKGFREMAEAIALARSRVPEIEIEWRVFGSAMLPPQNEIAPYLPLGFLAPPQLAEEYRKADILLSASWYESFPLFPIEAMACGLPVITSQYGTEEYAKHGVTAEIIKPKSPQSIAQGLLHLIQSPEYRHSLAVNGNGISKEFTWERSVDRFERIITRDTQI